MKGHDTTRRSRTARTSFLAGLAAFAAPATVWASNTAASSTLADPATGWNHLWHHVLVDLMVIGVAFSLAAVYMLIKYRAKSPTDVGQAPKLSTAQVLAWTLIPAAIFMADDFFLAAKGWVLWNTQRTVPQGALEVRLTAQQFYWEFDYGNGLVTTNELKVPVGQPVVLRMTATDVIHSFFIPDFRVKEDVMPGRKTYLWFVAREPGKTLATCTEFCGVGHSQMPATIEAVPPVEFDAWLKSNSKTRQVSALPDQSN
jgi:cytochrome c oxidase subunit 2